MFKFIFGLFLIGAGFFRTVFHDPVWGLYLFAALSHIRLEQLGENITLPLRIPIVVASVTLVVYVFSANYQHKFRKWPAEVWLFGIMVLGMCLGSSTAKFDPELSWMLTFDYVKYWIFFILLIQMIDSIKKVEWFHRVMILSSAWLVYRCWDLRGTTGPRFENYGGGNVADANHFAAALVMLFPFVFQKALSRDRRLALGAAILCFGIVMSIVISGSRGGLLGLGTLCVLLMLTFREQRWKILAFMIAIGLVALPFITDYQMDRFSSVFADEGERDSSAKLRIEFWKLAYQLFMENPLLGVAPGEFMYYSGYMVEGHARGIPGHVTHSLWFEMLSRGGLVFFPFVLMLVRFFRHSSRLVRRYKAAGEDELATYVQIPMIALGAFLVPATFLDRSSYEPLYWCIGLGIVHRYLAKEHFKRKSAESDHDLQGREIGTRRAER
jgi:putative inorganic carbon (HCO3(-)) transporter